ncbi:MAG: hypothetical protein NVSMB13_00610 [Mycobacteriales bacterium]
MSLALYRKYRPGTFAEVIGQDHVTAPLQQALRNGKVHHAYLFSGPRGCGKTSSARILARSLNCEHGPTPAPCGMCDSCVALAPNGAGSLDVVEIDAASHGLIEDARDLRERAFYAPVSSPYKIYVVDEAHMVTAGAFNALLKLVEEPPPHLKFVFATTEPDKVLTTIRSRTHHYPFRLVPAGVLREHLAGVCAREGVEVDPLVLPLVVRAGAGSVRDALSIMDQLLAGADADGVTYARAVSLLGYTDASLLDEVVDAFAAADGSGVFTVIDKVMEGGHDPRRFAADLLERLRDLVILDAVPEAAAKGLLDLPAEQLERMSGQATRMGTAALSRAADLLNTGLTEMRGAIAPRLLLELVCARVLLPGAATDEGAVLSRLERLERRMAIAPEAAASPQPTSPPPAAAPPAAKPAPAATPPPAAPPAPAATPPAGAPVSAVEEAAGGPLDAAAVRRVWADVLDAVKVRRRTARALLQDAQVSEVRGRSMTLSFQHATLARQFAGAENTAVLCEALKEVLGVEWQVECVVDGAAGGAAASVVPGSGQAAPTSPATSPEGFAPGDEPGDEPGEDEPSAAPRLSGEEAALALIQSGLGARVIGELDAG